MFKNKATRTFARLIILLFVAIVLATAIGGSRFRKLLYERFDLNTVAMYYGYFAFLVTIFIVTYYLLKEFADNRRGD